VLEIVDLRKKIEPAAYKRVFPKLQERLRGLQYALHEAEIPVVIALEGWDASGRGEIIHDLSEVLDPRLFRVHRGKQPTPLEQRYHFLWRYQIALPGDGNMALYDHSWYGRVLVERVDKLVRKTEWQQAYEQINEFERWLADDKQVLLKFWLHISKKEQKKRFRKTLADKNLRWKITKEYRRHHKQYEKWVPAVEEMLAKTDSPHAPWAIVEATDPRWRRVKVFQVLIRRIERALARREARPLEVFRTTAAREAMAPERERRQRADHELARRQATREGEKLEAPEQAARRSRKKTASPKRRTPRPEAAAADAS